VLDVKTPFPSSSLGGKDFVQRSHEANSAKYAPIATAYATAYTSCPVLTFIIPSVGPIPTHSLDTLVAAGLNKTRSRKLLRECSEKAAKRNCALASTLPKRRVGAGDDDVDPDAAPAHEVPEEVFVDGVFEGPDWAAAGGVPGLPPSPRP